MTVSLFMYYNLIFREIFSYMYLSIYPISGVISYMKVIVFIDINILTQRGKLGSKKVKHVFFTDHFAMELLCDAKTSPSLLWI